MLCLHVVIKTKEPFRFSIHIIVYDYKVTCCLAEIHFTNLHQYFRRYTFCVLNYDSFSLSEVSLSELCFLVQIEGISEGEG